MYATGRSVRNPFTQREDDLLLRYIAKHNPLPAGRSGEKLYKMLAENAGNVWPWSRAHTWQSWRERYRKNQAEFDSKIRKYLRRRAAAAEEEVTVKKEGVPPKPRREDNNVVRKPTNAPVVPVVDKSKGKEVTAAENRRQDASNSRRVQPVEELQKKKISNENDERRVMPKSGKPSDVPATNGSGPQVRQHPRAEGTNGRTTVARADATPSRVDTSNVADRTTAPSPPIDEAELAEEEDDEDLMRELFGSFVEGSQSQQKAEELVPDSEEEHQAAISLSNIQSVYPELPTDHVEAEQHIPGAFEATPHELVLPSPPPDRPIPRAESSKPMSAAHPPASHPVQKKAKPKLRKPAEDPFATPSEASPQPQPPPRQQYGHTRGLPVLVENGFRATLKRQRRSSTGDPNAAQWPPKRVKRTAAAAAAPSKKAEEQDEDMDVDDASPAQKKAAHILSAQRPTHVNAVASSSKSMLPPAPAVAPKPDQLPAQNAKNVKPALVGFSRTVVAHISPPTRAEVAKKKVSPVFGTLRLVTRTSSVHAPPAVALSDSDPFMAKKVSERDKGKARADFVINDKPPPKIDLHKQSLNRRLTNTSISISANRSGSSSHASSLSATRKKRQSGGEGNSSLRKSIIGIMPADPKFELIVAAAEDITHTLAQMAAAFGVGEQIAQATYVRTRSLEKTKFILQQLRDAMAEKEKALYAAMPELAGQPNDDAAASEGDDSDEEIPAGLVLRSKVKVKEEPREERIKRPSKSPIKSPRNSGRPSLSIRPMVGEEDLSLTTEYLPPNGSRAGEFARLMKQGRVSEAVEREKRRVSGIFVPDTQNPRRSSPPLASVSPTPRSQARDAPTEVDNDDEEPSEADEEQEPIAENVAPEAEAADDDDDDDMYVRDDEIDREADDESDHQEAEAEKEVLSSPPWPTTKALIKRLSGGRDNEPEFLAKAERHRELALAVRKENDGELRQFEKEHNKGMLRLWSVHWVQEMLSAYPKVQEDQAADS